MTSSQKCSDTGVADVDDFTVTVNHVFLQTIEHIDQNGYSGNLADMLTDALHDGTCGPYLSPRLIPNSPLNALLIPPMHRKKIQPILAALRNIKI